MIHFDWKWSNFGVGAMVIMEKKGLYLLLGWFVITLSWRNL